MLSSVFSIDKSVFPILWYISPNRFLSFSFSAKAENCFKASSYFFCLYKASAILKAASKESAFLSAAFRYSTSAFSKSCLSNKSFPSRMYLRSCWASAWPIVPKRKMDMIANFNIIYTLYCCSSLFLKIWICKKRLFLRPKIINSTNIKNSPAKRKYWYFSA